MEKDRDLVYETGPRNWIDCVAGEAVLLGQVSGDPELTVMGTRVAGLVREIPYDSEQFYLVEVAALDLEKVISEKKNASKKTWFIDEVCEGKKECKPRDKWEYDFICTDGRYQIKMWLFAYDKYTVADERKMRAEEQARCFFDDPSFETYEKVYQELNYPSQVFKNTYYYDNDGRLLRRIVDHGHEDGYSRGWTEFFYFDDFAIATDAWTAVKKIVTSDRRR